MKNRPWTVTLNMALILVNIVIWLVLGLVIMLEAYPTMSVPSQLKGIMAGMSFMMMAILLIMFIFLVRGNKKAYFLMLLFFVVTAVLTLFDEVGLSDIVVLLLNIIPVVLLVLDRNWYLRDHLSIQPDAQPHEP